ncbi:VirB8/TrbF family protein, partial [Pseudomonas amygdali]|uniref:VirB8/TrbF family protein n=1 Tax=Pseudomonas amygdali TaxID=47877 RepID=UPI0006E6A97A
MKKFRKSKQDVIEQERQLAARTSIDAATAQDISLAEQAFIHAARYFEKNIAADEKAKTKNARRLAGFFGVLTFMSIAAVMGLTPLKTVQLGLVRVDRNSGYTDVVWADDKGKPPEQID